MKSVLDPSRRAELVERTARLRPDAPRRWGRMSAHGMVCHLNDSFLACLGDRGATDVSSLFGRTLMRFVAISTPIPWPKGVPTVPEVDQEVGGTPPGDFEADVARLHRLIEEFAARLDRPDALRHPLFGRLSASEWGRWAYRHVDHHARQFGL